jgi:NAD(P)-dependent dehydrogenase (short-subunit alcohol dehydrogenase family)
MLTKRLRRFRPSDESKSFKLSNSLYILNFLFLFHQCTEEVWDKIFDVNVKSSFFLAKEALPHMEKRGKASIIFISSAGGYLPNCAVINFTNYSL